MSLYIVYPHFICYLVMNLVLMRSYSSKNFAKLHIQQDSSVSSFKITRMDKKWYNLSSKCPD